MRKFFVDKQLNQNIELTESWVLLNMTAAADRSFVLSEIEEALRAVDGGIEPRSCNCKGACARKKGRGACPCKIIDEYCKSSGKRHAYMNRLPVVGMYRTCFSVFVSIFHGILRINAIQANTETPYMQFEPHSQ